MASPGSRRSPGLCTLGGLGGCLGALWLVSHRLKLGDALGQGHDDVILAAGILADVDSS